MNTYKCGKCGNDFEATSRNVHSCGMDQINKYKEGDFIPDVLVYICDTCYKKIKSNG